MSRSCQAVPTLHIFKVKLKTHFYSVAFNEGWELKYLGCCIVSCIFVSFLDIKGVSKAIILFQKA